MIFMKLPQSTISLNPRVFEGTQKLQNSLDEIVKCLEALENTSATSI